MTRLFLALLLAAQVWGATAYTNENGTGERRRSVIVTASGSTVGGGNVTLLVDGDTTIGSRFWFVNGVDVTGKWLRFDFGEPYVISEAKWYQSTTANLGTWKWRGSDDAINWSDIGSGFTLGGATAQTQTSLSGNATGFRYYQLLGVSGTASSTPSITETEFKIQAVRTNGTLYSNVGGVGNRTATITATSSSGLLGVDSGGTAATTYVDGQYTVTASTTFINSVDVTGQWIKFDFGVGSRKLIDEAAWRQSTAGDLATWRWQGSNDDSVWTNIGGSFTLAGTNLYSPYHSMRTLHGNMSGYRYYRLLGVSGTSAAAKPYTLEVEFRIADNPSRPSAHPYIM